MPCKSYNFKLDSSYSVSIYVACMIGIKCCTWSDGEWNNNKQQNEMQAIS